MLYPTNLSTNLKNVGVNANDLHKNVIVCGPNGGGKTAVLHSLQLVLSGLVHDYAGRDEVKLADALRGLIPLGEKAGTAAVILSDGAICSWGITDTGTPTHSGPPIAFRHLYEEVEAALIGTNPKARAIPYLVKHFVPASVVRASRPEIPENTLKALVAYRNMHKDLSGSDGLVAIYNSAKKDAAAHKKAGKKYTEALNVLDSLDSSTAARLFDGIQSCTNFNIMQDTPTCGVCAHEVADMEVYSHRHDQAKGALATHDKGTYVPAHLKATLVNKAYDAEVAGQHAAKVAEVALQWMGDSFDAYAEQLSEHINKRLPAHLHVALDNGKRFRIMTQRADGYVEPTSGAETVIVLTAIAACVSVASPEPSLIVVPDRAYDKKSIKLLMGIIEKAQCGGWLQLLNRPAGRLASKWSVIETV